MEELVQDLDCARAPNQTFQSCEEVVGLKIGYQGSVKAPGHSRLLVRSPLDAGSIKEQGVCCRLRGRTRTWGTTEDVGCFVNDWNAPISELKVASRL